MKGTDKLILSLGVVATFSVAVFFYLLATGKEALDDPGPTRITIEPMPPVTPDPTPVVNPQPEPEPTPIVDPPQPSDDEPTPIKNCGCSRDCTCDGKDGCQCENTGPCCESCPCERLAVPITPPTPAVKPQPQPAEPRYRTPFWCWTCQQFSYYKAPLSQQKTTCAHCRSVAVRTTFQKRSTTPPQTIEQWGNEPFHERTPRWRPFGGFGSGFGGGFGGGFGSTMGVQQGACKT